MAGLGEVLEELGERLFRSRKHVYRTVACVESALLKHRSRDVGDGQTMWPCTLCW